MHINSKLENDPRVYIGIFGAVIGIAYLILLNIFLKFRKRKIKVKESFGYYKHKKVVYSPPLYIIMILVWAPSIFFPIVFIVFSYLKIISFSFDLLIFLFVLNIFWIPPWLAFGKKTLLGKSGLIIKRLLPFLKEKKINYEDIVDICAGDEISILGATSIPRIAKAPILYIKLKDGNTMRLDLPDEGGVKDFFGQLIEKINKFKK